MRGILSVAVSFLALCCSRCNDSPPTPWGDSPPCLATSFVEVSDADLSFYWPGKCDRCHLLARTSVEAVACCSGESNGWDCRDFKKRKPAQSNHSENIQCAAWTADQKENKQRLKLRDHTVPNHQCSRYPNATDATGEKYSMRLRQHLRYRMDGLSPSAGSTLDRFVDLVGDRRVVFLGDSVLRQFREFLDVRAEDLHAGNLTRHPGLLHYMQSRISFADCYNHAATCTSFKTVAPESAAHHGTIVISSFGNHFTNRAGKYTYNNNGRDAYEATLLDHLARLNGVAARASQNVAIHLGPFAQHFASETGEHGSRLSDRDARVRFAPWFDQMVPHAWFDLSEAEDPGAPRHARGYRCMPPTARKFDCRTAESRTYYARVIMSIPRENFPVVEILPFDELTQELYDVHFGGLDCTHWCYMPGLIEAAVHLINEAIAASDDRHTRNDTSAQRGMDISWNSLSPIK